MTFLLFQAFLLMAAAYFLGAFLGCWWRRTFYASADVRLGRSDADVVAVAGAAASALNVPRNDPIPVQPRIEYFEAPDAIADRNRFERALSGVGSLDQAPPHDDYETTRQIQHEVETAHQQAETQHFKVEPRRETAQQRVDDRTFFQGSTTPAIEPKPAADSAAVKVTDDAVAAAAAAAAAVAAAAARNRVVKAAPSPIVSAPPPPPLPPISAPVDATAGTMSAGIPSRMPPLMPADSQDLKLIRNIDADVERTLNSLGVWRYADIARWGQGDVAAVNSALASRSRVQRENWIEQATILSRGGFTAYARRRLRGEAADAHPTDTARPPRGPIVSAPARAPQPPSLERQELRTPSAMATSAAAAVAAAAASASRGRAAPPSDRRLAPVRAPRPVITEIAEAKPPATPTPAPQSGVSKRPAEPSAPPAAPAPASIQTPPLVSVLPPAVGTAAQALADSLQRIRGVDPTVEHMLHDSGVTRYAQIAEWTALEVEYFDELMEQPGRVSRENWIEQAHILARGGSTLFARQRDQGAMQIVGGAAAIAAAAASAATSIPAEPRAARPSRLADAMRVNQERAPAPAAPVPAEHDQSQTDQSEQSVQQPVRNDVAGLRSVRSEALRSDSFGGPADSVDDLKRIRGIGVLIEKKLNSLGIASYDQIAHWTADDVAAVSELLDFRGRIERENWIEQARILSAGGHTEFSRRADRGDAS